MRRSIRALKSWHCNAYWARSCLARSETAVGSVVALTGQLGPTFQLHVADKSFFLGLRDSYLLSRAPSGRAGTVVHFI